MRRQGKTKIQSENVIKNSDNQHITQRRKKIVKKWQKERTFELEDEAFVLAAVKIEQTWAINTTNKTDKGKKVIYRCKNVKSRGSRRLLVLFRRSSIYHKLIKLNRNDSHM